MNQTEAATFRLAHDAYVKRLDKLSTGKLKFEYKRELAERNTYSVMGGPRSKDELISALVELRYPIKKLNESIHTMAHDAQPWPDCEFCKEAGVQNEV